MRFFLIVFVIGLLVPPLIAQNQETKDFNGWEFLEWKSDKKAVEKQLIDKGIKIQETFSDPAYDKIIRFQYNDLKTRLDFDSLNQLSGIKQYKEFSVNQDKEAITCFNTVTKALMAKYGKPSVQGNDTVGKITHLIWDLKFTEVLLAYDYGYKVIDEFGGIYFNPFAQADTSKYAIIPYNTAYDKLFKNCEPAFLTTRDLTLIEENLKKHIGTSNLVLQTKGKDSFALNNYKRQYLAVVNKNGQKEVWVNCFCRNWNKDWQKEVFFVKKEIPCYFNLKINLITGTEDFKFDFDGEN